MAYTVNSYKDKYMGVDNRLSVYDILQKVGTTEYREGAIKKYEAVDIAEVKIDGNRFRNYGAYSFIWEKTFVKSPERSANGSLGNLNSYATFLTPHLIMDFSVMSIDDYRKIMLLHYGANEYTVECYDPIYNRKIKVKMYFGTEEMAKLYTIAQNRLLPDGQWEEWVDLVGVTEYKVELIGTNNDLDLVSVKYEYNAPLDDNGLPIYPSGAPIQPQYEEDIYLGEEIVIGGNSNFKDTPPNINFVFDYWLGSDGLRYSDGLIKTINEPITFYAQWKDTKDITLYFNYGLSDVDTEYDSETGIVTEIRSRRINKKGDSIGKLPKLTEEPVVKGSDGTEYHPYYNGGWYKHPIKPEDEEAAENLRVYDNTHYWSDRNDAIYAIYDKKLFKVTYHENMQNTYVIDYKAQYQDRVNTPNLAYNGYIFQGWYTDEAMTKKFSGYMPPHDVNLYAKWVAK